MQNNQSVLSVTKKIIKKIHYQKDTPSRRATLAKIRKTIGKPLSEAVEVWPILFSNLPENFLSSYSHPSNEELAIYTAIQFYALQPQGDLDITESEEETQHQNIGESLSQMRRGQDTTAIDRRFNVMITSETFEEFTYHLRHLLQLLKSQSPNTKVDYPSLAGDLYWYLKGKQETIRLNWARSYYKQYVKGEENNDN